MLSVMPIMDSWEMQEQLRTWDHGALHMWINWIVLDLEFQKVVHKMH